MPSHTLVWEVPALWEGRSRFWSHIDWSQMACWLPGAGRVGRPPCLNNTQNISWSPFWIHDFSSISFLQRWTLHLTLGHEPIPWIANPQAPWFHLGEIGYLWKQVFFALRTNLQSCPSSVWIASAVGLNQTYQLGRTMSYSEGFLFDMLGTLLCVWSLFYSNSRRCFQYHMRYFLHWWFCKSFR